MATKMKKTLALLMALVLCVSQLALPVMAETATEPTAEITVEAPEVPTEEPAEVPIEEPAEAPVEASIEEPIEEPIEAPVEASIEEPVEEPIEAPVEESIEEPAEVSTVETLADGTEVYTSVETSTNEATGEQTTTEIVETYKNEETSYPGTLDGEEGTFTEYGYSGTTTTTTTTITPDAEGTSEDVILAEESEGEFDSEHLTEDTAETITTTEAAPETTETEFAPEGEATGTASEDFSDEGEASVTTEATGTETTENANITVDPMAEVLIDAEGNPITDESGTILTEEEAKLEFTTETTTTTEEVETEGEGSSSEITYTGLPVKDNQEYIGLEVNGNVVVLDAGNEDNHTWLANGTYDADKITIEAETDDEGNTTGSVTISVPLGSGNGGTPSTSVTTLTAEDFKAMGIEGKVVGMTLNEVKSINSQSEQFDNVIMDLKSVTIENPDGTTTIIEIVEGKPVTDEYKVLVTKEDVIPEQYLTDDYTITEEYDADGNHIGWTATPNEATQDGDASTEYSDVTEGQISYTDEETKIVSNADMDALAQTVGSGVSKLADSNGDPYYEETSIQTSISNPITGEAMSLTEEELAKYEVADVASSSSTYTPPLYPYVPEDYTDEYGRTEHYELETTYNEDGSVASYKLIRTFVDADGLVLATDYSESFGTTTTVDTLTVTDPLTKQETTITKTTVKTVTTYVFTETTRVEQTELNRTETTTTDYVSSSESFLLAEGSSMYFEFEGTMYPVEDLNEEDDLKITDITNASISVTEKAEESYTYTDDSGEAKTAKQYNASVSFTVELSASAINSDDLIAEVLDSNGNSLGKYRLTQNPSWATNLVDLVTGTSVATSSDNTYTLDGLVLPNGVPFSVTLTDPTAGSYTASGGNAATVAAANGADLAFDMVFSINEPEFIHTTTTNRYSEISEQQQTSTKEQTQKKTGMTVESVTTEYTADRTSIVIRGNVDVTSTETNAEKSAWGGMELGFEADPTVPTETIPEETTPEETVPEETIPEETIPEETVPVETIPEETIPEETVPKETIPEETIPEETVPEETIPEETIPEETVPEETIPEVITPPEEPVPYDDDFPIPEGNDGPGYLIPDEEVPLAAVPETGDLTGLWAAISLLSLGGTAALSRKRKEEEEDF